jgi:hypothetical protein
MHHNLVIEPRACPRCGIGRTARFLRACASFCFNCRWQWDWSDGAPSRFPVQPPAVAIQLGERAEQPYLFSPDDLARLRFVRWLSQTGRLHEGEPG